ncbi:MAG: dTDP-glucose 4,6-dehydratase [Planctomycetes bacterium]|nr:dTDP-glucose 4,6-dehydratase [Planctomycetota bacterium]
MPTAHTPRRILVTGGAGFIGANFVRLLLAEQPDLIVINVDALTYAGGRANLAGLDEGYPGRHQFVQADIRDREAMARVFAETAPDTVVNFAAESHVDRSIDDPLAFVETNVLGTAVLLDAARRAWRGRRDVRFHQVSTDEVYGALGETGRFHEAMPYDPSSPYSASKAGADHLVRAWHRTFGLPVTLSNCSNNYGPWQFPEKLIPLTIANALAEKPLPVYGRGANVRDWLHVEDHARAIWLVVTGARAGSAYVIGGDNEWTNLDLVRLICDRLDALRPRAGGSYRELITFVPDRPGHDARYAIDGSRIRRDLHWRPVYEFRIGLDQTIRWYLDNADWVQAIRTGRYAGERLGLGS